MFTGIDTMREKVPFKMKANITRYIRCAPISSHASNLLRLPCFIANLSILPLPNEELSLRAWTDTSSFTGAVYLLSSELTKALSTQ